MRKYVRAALVEEFLKYHDDENNYNDNRDGFDKMYAILEKYDDSNGRDTVDVAFNRAPESEQRRMLELITPRASAPGQDGYAQRMYYEAMSGDWSDDRSYNEGIVDAFEALFEEGWISESAFRTDL